LLVDRPRPQAQFSAAVGSARAPASAADAAFAGHDLTALSWVRAGRTSIAGRFRSASRLARRSLLPLAMAVSTQGCLVTADPVSYEPQPTPPIILTTGLDPDPRRIHRLGGVSGVTMLDIKASVLSEDAGQTIKTALFIDYGHANAQGQPFRFFVQSFPELAPSTLGAGPRDLQGVDYFLASTPLVAGCHRLTLVVTHAFDTKSGCPKQLFDSDQVTWHFNRCNEDGSDCADSVEDCPPIEASCPEETTKGTAASDAGTTGG
jgi:hypothetical protein